jgi:hypothetical protein
LQNEALLAKKKFVGDELALFGEVRWCLDAATMAVNMELRSKTLNLCKAGQ